MITSADAARDAPPLSRLGPVLIKVHGDYLRPDLRNTVEELGSYDPALERLLARVLDEHGLIVCGWSAEWDSALRALVSEHRSPHYASYWAVHGTSVGDTAKELIATSGAVEVPIESADELFEDLAAKVAALSDLGSRRAPTTTLAVATLKQRMADPVQRIRLHDMVMQEVAELVADTGPDRFPVRDVNVDRDAYLERLVALETASETLVCLLATLSFFAEEPRHNDLAVRAVDALLNRPREEGGVTFLLDAQHYPACLAMYGVGVAATATHNWELLTALLRLSDRGDLPPWAAVERCWPAAVLDTTKLQAPGQARLYTPAADRVAQVLRPVFASLVVHEADFDNLFDDFEYLTAIQADHLRDEAGALGAGRYRWRRRYGRHGSGGSWSKVIEENGESLSGAGFLDGDPIRLREVDRAHSAWVGNLVLG